MFIAASFSRGEFPTTKVAITLHQTLVADCAPSVVYVRSAGFLDRLDCSGTIDMGVDLSGMMLLLPGFLTRGCGDAEVLWPPSKFSGSGFYAEAAIACLLRTCSIGQQRHLTSTLRHRSPKSRSDANSRRTLLHMLVITLMRGNNVPACGRLILAGLISLLPVICLGRNLW